jgi:hypothetical protein
MNDFLNVLKGLSPTLASIALGPAGGAVVSAIADKFGVSADVDAIAKAIAGDPQAAQKLAEIDLAQFQAEAADRDSARKREAEIASTGPWYSKIVTPLIAVMVTTAWFAIQWFLLNHTVATEMREIIIRVLGNLDAAFMLVLSYYFGASHHK